MPPRCSICSHSDRTAIETAIAAGASLRSIAHQHGTTHTALARHRDNCGALTVADARQAADVPRQSQVRSELARILERANLLFDACDRYLRDTEHPERYDIGPRAEDLTVIYTVPLDQEGLIRMRRKEQLSTLIAKVEAHPNAWRVVATEYKVADPRDLVLKTMVVLGKHLELLAKLTGELKEAQQVNILVMPEWLGLRDRLLEALMPHPDALEAVIDALG